MRPVLILPSVAVQRLWQITKCQKALKKSDVMLVYFARQAPYNIPHNLRAHCIAYQPDSITAACLRKPVVPKKPHRYC